MKIFFVLILSLLKCSCSLLAADWEVYVAKYKHDKECAISYTFDDGLVEHYTVVFQNWRNAASMELFGYVVITQSKECLLKFLG